MIKARWQTVFVMTAAGMVASANAQEAVDPLLDLGPEKPAAASKADAAETVKPDIGEQIYSQGVKWNTVVKQVEIRIADETPLRQELARLQQRLGSLYSGVELVDLIEQTKNQIAIREAELSTRANSFDQRMLTIKQELEELRRAAVAVGAGSELEAMIESANQAAKVPVGETQPRATQPAGGNRQGFNLTKPMRGATQPTPRSIKPF